MSIFTFLKRKSPVQVTGTTNVSSTITPSKPRSASEQLIFEIHQEFDSAEDRLLKQAEDIIQSIKPAEVQPIEDRAKRLQALGFSKAKTVVKAEEISKERAIAEKILVTTEAEAKLIKYYKQTYPFLKFLTESELDRICNKYGLIHAPVSAYSDDVPEKNLKEIENAQPLKSIDKDEPYKILCIDQYLSSCPDEIKSILDKNKNTRIPRQYTDDKPSEVDVMSLVKSLGYTGDYNRWIYNEATYKTIDKSGLFICAPKSHFDLTGLSFESKFGYNLIDIKQDVKDPIVFRYVKGGVQVLSKWGLEDESLIEPNSN